MSFEENRNTETQNSIAANKIIENKFNKLINKAVSIGYVMYVPHYYSNALSCYSGPFNTYTSPKDSHNVPYFQFNGYFIRGFHTTDGYEINDSGDKIIDENDLQLRGYQYYEISESYDGYNYHNETGTYVSGYTGTIRSNGNVDIRENRSTYTYGVATAARKINTAEFYLRVIPKEHFDEVMRLENSIDWTKYNELQNNEPTVLPQKSDAVKRNVFALLSHLLVFLSILFSSSASPDPIPTVDAAVLNSIAPYKALMALIPVFIVPILFIAGFAFAIVTYRIQKTKLKPLKNVFGTPGLIIVYLIFITILFALPLILSYALPPTFDPTKSNWVIYYYMLGILRFVWLVLSIVFIILSITRITNNSQYNKAVEIISARKQYVDSGKYDQDQNNIQKIKNMCVKITL